MQQDRQMMAYSIYSPSFLALPFLHFNEIFFLHLFHWLQVHQLTQGRIGLYSWVSNTEVLVLNPCRSRMREILRRFCWPQKKKMMIMMMMMMVKKSRRCKNFRVPLQQWIFRVLLCKHVQKHSQSRLCLKRLRTAAFASSEPLFLSRLNGRRKSRLNGRVKAKWACQG